LIWSGADQRHVVGDLIVPLAKAASEHVPHMTEKKPLTETTGNFPENGELQSDVGGLDQIRGWPRRIVLLQPRVAEAVYVVAPKLNVSPGLAHDTGIYARPGCGEQIFSSNRRRIVQIGEEVAAIDSMARAFDPVSAAMY